jgi:hypothetical protein
METCGTDFLSPSFVMYISKYHHHHHAGLALSQKTLSLTPFYPEADMLCMCLEETNNCLFAERIIRALSGLYIYICIYIYINTYVYIYIYVFYIYVL